MVRWIGACLSAILIAACTKAEPSAAADLPDPPPPTAAGSSPPTPRAPSEGTGGHDAGDCEDASRCPLRLFMRENAAKSVESRDFGSLVATLDRIASFAPPGYPYWVSIAKDGADAARVQDIEAVHAACRGCHSQYRERYKSTSRDRPIGN